MEAKIIKVDVPPAAAGLVNDADEDLAALDRLQIDNYRPQVLGVFATHAVEHAIVISRDDIDPRLPTSAAANKETAKRMRHLKRRAGQSPLRLIAQLFVASNPI